VLIPDEPKEILDLSPDSLIGVDNINSEKLLENNLVDSIADIYYLDKEDLISLEKFADKSAQNLIEAIESSKQQQLPNFLYGLGVPQVGEKTAQILSKNFKNLQELKNASQKDLENIKDIGPEIAEQIIRFFAEEENLEMIQKMKKAGLELNNPYSKKELPLSEMEFAFTGGLDEWTRDEVKQLVQKKGAETAASVTDELDYLVVGEDPGSKLDEARKKDIPTMNEKEFKEFLEEK
jgi:DNA ligase (NAD+)